MPYYSEAQLSQFVDTIMERLRAIEAQLVLVSEKVGLPYEASDSGRPADVVEMVKNGDRLGAIRRYRELTGADTNEAAAAINKI
jgi:ribosomal protein L7/L12